MLVEESGIRPEVIAVRGYRTVTQKRQLEELGFAPAQRRVPTLILPIHGVGGQVVNHQSRPDAPRRGRDGQVIKYETPRGSHMMLDVPPVVHHLLPNPKVPLFVTEGIKKGDALAGHSTPETPFGVVTLLGVWNWRGTNEDGGKAPVPCWYSVALNDRLVYVVFDGDVMVKRTVWYALAALKPFLESRGATVRLVYLPQTLDGHKCGVDDYLAAGHAMQALRELSTSRLSPPPPLLDLSPSPRAVPYEATPKGLVMYRQTLDGALSIPLTNFNAAIQADILEDDGTEVRRSFVLEATREGRTTRFQVPAAQFPSMSWVAEHLGAAAIIMPGNAIKDHARAAIQMLSAEIEERRVYTHTGWRQLDEQWYYLHAGGAMGAQGAAGRLHVTLDQALADYHLPEPPVPPEAAAAIAASLRLLEVADDAVTVPIFAGIWRAALGHVDLSLHLAGKTGIGKSVLAALAQQHYGPEMTSRRLPASWSSTGNALEALAFQAKDALVVIDDFCPTGSQADVQRAHRDADRVLRAQGNQSGRQRMRPDGTLRPPKPPRGLILSTGEDTPRGQSLRARMLILDISPTTLRWEQVSDCQRDAAAGLYAQALAGFVHWLAPRYDAVARGIAAEVHELREQAVHSVHRRTTDIMANLGLALRYFLAYAQDRGALNAEACEQLWQRFWAALAAASAAQEEHQSTEEPVARFFALLSGALMSGRAHVADAHTFREPGATAAHWGWRQHLSGSGLETRETWQAYGDCVGWLREDRLYLDPEAVFRTVQKFASEQNAALAMTQRTLWKRMREQNVLMREPSRSQNTVVRVLGPNRKRVRVLDVAADLLSMANREFSDPADPPSQTGGSALAADRGLPSWQHPFVTAPAAAAPPAATSSMCPQCRAQHAPAIGSYRWCRACGHKWRLTEAEA